MTAPMFQSFVVLLTGSVFARRRTVTRIILAADVVEEKHPKRCGKDARSR